MAKVGHFAGEARLTDAADMKKPGEAGEAKRLTLLAAMVHTLRVSARDEVTDMFCKRMAIIHRAGRPRRWRASWSSRPSSRAAAWSS